MNYEFGDWLTTDVGELVKFGSYVEDGSYPSDRAWIYDIDEYGNDSGLSARTVWLDDLSPLPSDYFSYGAGI